MRKITFTMLYALFYTTIVAQSPCPPSQIRGIHIVQSGETLYSIAKRYRLSIEQVRQWNNLSYDNILQTCVELKVAENVAYDNTPKIYNTPIVSSKSIDYSPEEEFDETRLPPTPNTYSQRPAVNATGTPNFAYFRKSPYLPFFHIVSHNETLESISRIYELSMGEIMMMNNFRDNTRLAAGQRLMLEDRRQMRGADYAFDENAYTPRPPVREDIPKDNNQSSRLKSIPSPTFEDSNPEVRTKAPAPKPAENPPIKPQPAAVPMSSNTSMTNEELDMVREINLVRGNPEGYISYINEYINHLRTTGDMGNSISTSQELINELKRTPRLSTLQPLQCVYIAAKKHGEDQKRRGDTDHQGSDGSWPWDRVKRECSNLQDGNENLVGGPANIRRAVILLLVDDGIDGRGHRKTMLNPDWKYVACYKMGTVGTMPNCWVQKYGY